MIEMTEVDFSKAPPSRTKGKGNGQRGLDVEEQRVTRRRNRGNAEQADWSAANADKLLEAIAAISRTHCAVQFGYTRDGGAYVVRIIGDGEPFNEFIRPSEDIDLYLEGLCLDYS
jgi:hypothetical protein